MKCLVCEEEIIDEPQELGFCGKTYVFCEHCCFIIRKLEHSNMMKAELYDGPITDEWNKMIDKIYINSGNKEALYLKKRPIQPIEYLYEINPLYKKTSFWCKLSSFFSRIFKGEKE